LFFSFGLELKLSKLNYERSEILSLPVGPLLSDFFLSVSELFSESFFVVSFGSQTAATNHQAPLAAIIILLTNLRRSVGKNNNGNIKKNNPASQREEPEIIFGLFQ